MKQSQVIIALVLLSIGIIPARAVTLLSDILIARDDTTIFAQMAIKSGCMDKYLAERFQTADASGTYTLFVPTDTAIQQNEKINLYLNGIGDTTAPWRDHLMEICKQHMVDGSALRYDDIFNLERTKLQTMRDEVPLNAFASKIQDAHLISQDIVADNGIMHVVDSVIRPSFFDESLAELELQSEYGPDDLGRTSLVTIAGVTGARNGILDQDNYTEGLTYLGCRIRAFNRIDQYLTQSILGGNDVKHSELLNESNAEMTDYHFFKYNMIPENLYFDDFLQYTLSGYERLVMPVNGCAHMWVTVKDGLLCFNDACIVTTPDARRYYASNGYGNVVDKCLVCPGVAMHTAYAAHFTSHDVLDTSNLFVSSLWNLRNLSLSVGNQESVTLFAPLDSGWGDFTLQDITRLSTLKWITHLRDLLKHFLTPGTWTRQDFVNLYRWNEHQPYYISMLTNEQVLIDYDEREDVLKFGEAVIYKSDVKGLDGIMHFVDQVNFPRSVAETCYDVGKNNANFSYQINLIDYVQIRSDLRSLSPLTCMFAPNSAWTNDNFIFPMETISEMVLENHVFKELWWCDDLRNMTGFRLESHNYETWRISVNEDNMPCFDTIPVFGGGSRRACIVECDILVRNGLVHILDDLMLFEQPEIAAPEPTHSPNFDPNSTNITLWDSSSDTDQAFVISGGVQNDAQSPAGQPTAASPTMPTLLASQLDNGSGAEGRTTMVGGLSLGILVISLMALFNSLI